MVELPRDLVTAISEGRTVLFLGAGASRGAVGKNGSTAPDASGLAAILINEFLGNDYAGLDLRTAYDLSCSVRDVRTVQKKIFEILDQLTPASFHKLIPKFPWFGLATTNYDLIIERAYQANPTDKIIPFVKDNDGSTDRLTESSRLYIKLHGCITRHQEVDPPLIASTEQLISFRDGRNGQFNTFLEWAKTKTILFVGYSFLDSNLRLLFSEIIKEGDNRPRHYIVNKGAREAEIGYWQDRRVIALDSTFEDFLKSLDNDLTDNSAVLGRLAADLSTGTSFSKFITTPGGKESAELKLYLNSLIDHVGDSQNPSPQDPKRFYSGFDLGWYSFQENLDVIVPLVNELKSSIRTDEGFITSHPITIIKGHAGSGKTVALRRACYDAATTMGKLCFFVSRQHSLVSERFLEIFSLTNIPILLFVDDIAHHRNGLLEVLRLARRQNVKIRVIAAENFNTWNVSCDELDVLVATEYETRYLSEQSITLLLEKLEIHDSLGYLSSLSREQQAHELKHVHGRQILVALLEATHGTPFIEIIEQEYQSIEPAAARLIYLDICSLHRFGPPVRAGLISRIHNISFEDFATKLFKPLEAIVVLRKDPKSGDYVYEARHSFIANTLYEAVLKTQEERFDNIIRIVNKLNPSFSYDQEVVSRLIHAGTLERTLVDHAKIRQVFDAAEAAFGKTAVIFHQRGIFEMHVANNLGGLLVAEKAILTALEIEPFNRSIKHSLAEVDLRRSRIAETIEERLTWRQSAVSKATGLLSKSTSPYPHHTLLKAAIDSVKDALITVEEDGGESATLQLGNAIAHAEATLKAGQRAFPNEAVLLSEEGLLSNVLSQAPRAEVAFEKAFAANERSTLIAKRLARIKRSKGSFDQALRVLRKCLEFNPGAQDVHYDLSMALLESSPNSDQSESPTLLYHLRRAFSPGDRNLQAQFWYARQLCIANRFDEAKPFFRKLSDSNVPYKEKIRSRGELCGGDGAMLELIGTVEHWREGWGFVHMTAPLEAKVFFKLQDEDDLNEYMTVGLSVRFNLAFSLKGPVAINLVS